MNEYADLCRPWEHDFTRRRFLGTAAGAAAGLGGLGGLLQPAVAEEIKRKEKQVLFIWLDGGMSQLETWDPKPSTQFGGPYRAVPTSVAGVHIGELMPKTAKLMHHLAVIRSLKTEDPNHSSGVPKIQRGHPKNRGVKYPYFGSAVAKLMGPTKSNLPPYVWVKPGSGGFKSGDAGFLGAKYGALALGDGKPPDNLTRHPNVSRDDDRDRNALRQRINARYAAKHRRKFNEANSYVYDVAQKLMAREDLFDPAKLAKRDIERYGTHDFGRHMLMGRRLLEAGVRFVKVNSYGWDTHGDNFNAHASMVPKVDQAFAAMLEDLQDRGMMDNVLVIMMSEFGRTPRINGSVGRDHWPNAWSLVMAGCGIRRGVVVGKTNATGTDVATKPHDIGYMFHTWFQALGINSRETEYHNGKQPLPIAHDDYAPIQDLLS